MKVIDCSKTENYFVEKRRMTKRQEGVCAINCVDCPLSSSNNGTNKTCRAFENCCASKAVEIIQKWSNEHPQKTYLTDFLDKHPNAPLTNGIPSGLCPYYLGYMTKKEFDECSTNCQQCWDTSIEESEMR